MLKIRKWTAFLKAAIPVFIVLLVILLIIGVAAAISVFSRAFKHYPDLNGPENSALNTVTLEDVLKDGNFLTDIAGKTVVVKVAAESAAASVTVTREI